MARYEVFVPAAPPKLPMDLTLRLEADHWLGALKTGLQRLGEPHMANNVLCDIQADGSIHVTDPDSHRVFRIVELPATAPAQGAPAVTPSRPQPAVAAPAAASAAPPRPAAAPVPVPPAPVPPAPVPRAPAAPAPGAGKPAPQPSRPAARPSGHADHVVETRTPISTPAHSIGRLTTPARAEDLLAELFLEVGELGRIKDRDAGLAFTLDAAMRIIGCEAGSVFTADLATSDLSFAVVRGPSADKVKALGLKVPVGVGLVGFCAQENVCVAVSDAEKDPRFYRAVSEATGYQTRSLLCAPMARHGQLAGCLEVLNKKGGKPFDQKDLAVLSYLAAQAAAFLGRFET